MLYFRWVTFHQKSGSKFVKNNTPKEVVSKLKEVADDVILLQTPPDFMAVGQYYQDFHQLDDEEVIELLR